MSNTKNNIEHWTWCPGDKIAKNTVWRSAFFVKNTLLLTAFSVILPAGGWILGFGLHLIESC